MEVDGESQAGGSSSSPLDETGILDAPKPGAFSHEFSAIYYAKITRWKIF